MSEIIEEFFQGYCRACDMARTAVGEFRLEDNKLVLDQIDCDYGTCIHGESCQMMKQVFAFMEQENEKRRE